MMKRFFLVLLLCLCCTQSFAAGSILYPWLTDYSFYGVASWAQPLIASGTSLPSTTNAFPGDLFINLATPSAPSLWRMGATDWILMSGASSGGVASHSALTQLDYSSSGHTGFASSGALLAHQATQIDPHGASQTFSAGVTVGSGTVDAEVYRLATGVIAVASYGYIPPMNATPTSPTDGYIWNDANTHKIRVYDGSAWNNLW